MPLVYGKTPEDWRTDFFCEHLMDRDNIPKWEGVRTERFVYARYFEQSPVYEFLHDLQIDPEQLENFADDPSYQDTLIRLRQRTEAFKTQYEDARQAHRYAPETHPHVDDSHDTLRLIRRCPKAPPVGAIVEDAYRLPAHSERAAVN